METFISLSPKERKNLFEEASTRKDLSPAVLEKDFWVCWVLQQIFSSETLHPYITFKGGTTLSKIHNLIHRFSEDIDLVIDKGFLSNYGYNSQKPKKINRHCKDVIRTIIFPHLKQIFSKCLNEKNFYDPATMQPLQKNPLQTEDGSKYIIRETNPHEWMLWIDNNPDDDDAGLCLLFHYPVALKYSSIDVNMQLGEKISTRLRINEGYIKPVVRLEFGARGESAPRETATIKPYLAEILPQIFPKEPRIEVFAIAAKRTFWEKATILHSICLRPMEKPLRKRMSRHFYDLAMMAENNEVLQSALVDINLLRAVVQNKQHFFEESWDWYTSATPGSMRLVPSEQRLEEIGIDYAAMQEMFFDNPPTFEKIVEILKNLEKSMNQ